MLKNEFKIIHRCSYIFDFYKLNVKVKVIFEFQDHDIVVDKIFLDQNILKNNLPSVNVILKKNFIGHSDIIVFIRKTSSKTDKYRLNINIGTQLISYETIKEKLTDDLMKFVCQLAAIKATKKNLVFIHAATLLIEDRAFLFPGEAGIGKSTIGLLWMSKGNKILSTETAVLDKDSVICGNEMLSIKKDTINYHIPGDDFLSFNEIGKYLFFEIKPTKTSNSKKIDSIIFIKITNPTDKIKEIYISKERGKMRLYDSIYWIINGGFLLSHKIPGIPLATYDNLKTVCKIIESLSKKDMFYIEGSANYIYAWMLKNFYKK